MEKDIFSLDKLTKIKQELADDSPDKITKKESENLDMQALCSADYRQDIMLKGVLAYSILGTAIGWLLIVAVILFIQMWHHGLSDAVLITLLSTTTLNVLSMVFIIARYLFPNSGRNSK